MPLKNRFTVMEIPPDAYRAQYPEAWDDEWLRGAIEELNTRQMSSEVRAAFACYIARNAETVNADRRRIEKLLQRSVLTPEEIANCLDVKIGFVLRTQEALKNELLLCSKQ